MSQKPQNWFRILAKRPKFLIWKPLLPTYHLKRARIWMETVGTVNFEDLFDFSPEPLDSPLEDSNEEKLDLRQIFLIIFCNCVTFLAFFEQFLVIFEHFLLIFEHLLQFLIIYFLPFHATFKQSLVLLSKNSVMNYYFWPYLNNLHF